MTTTEEPKGLKIEPTNNVVVIETVPVNETVVDDLADANDSTFVNAE